MADAIRFVLREHGFRAGRHSVGYRSCDDSTAQTGNFDRRTCAANANAYAHAEKLVAVIGPYNSFCAQIEIPILNRAPGGPLAMISSANTYAGPDTRRLRAALGLPRRAGRLLPDRHPQLRPGGPTRRHARRRARAAGQGPRTEERVPAPGRRRNLGRLLIDPFRYAARRLDVPIAGSAAFDPEAASFDQLADRVARSGADGVLLGGDPFVGGDRLLKALRERLGTRVTIMAGFYYALRPRDASAGRPAARGVYVTTSDLPRAAARPEPRRRALRCGVRRGRHQASCWRRRRRPSSCCTAIARSDGTRASVLEELRASRVKDGILGSFRFDRNGDMTPATVPIIRITGATPPQAGLPSNFQGAIIDRVVEIPRRLVR